MHAGNISRAVVIAFGFWAAGYSLAAPAQPYASVNPFIGTGQAGNCYPGAQAPFGMISWSPNTTFDDYESVPSRPGYKYDRNEIYGFALTHISGVGCHAAQDLPIMPVLGELKRSPVNHQDAYSSHFDHAHEVAHPGRYEVNLSDSGVDVRLAVAERSGMGEFKFSRAGRRSILFRASEVVNHLSAASMFIDVAHRRISGSVSSGGFCSRDPKDNPYTLYFAAEFSAPISACGGWNGETKHEGETKLSGTDLAAYVSFDENVPAITMRIGLSYVSEAGAAANLAAEIPTWSVDDVAAKTRANWEQLLGRLEIEADADTAAKVYTALYHNLLQPSLFDDVSGDYLGFDGKVHRLEPGHHKYVGFSNWDTYRTSAALQGLLFSEATSDMIASLILDYEQGAPAGLPIWGYFNHDSRVMNGYSAIPFIANAWAFGARNIDEKRVLQALIDSADRHYGRGAEYLKHGYVPSYDGPWNFSVSMTLEYAIDDFCVSRMAAALGEKAEAARFLKRSQNVFNLLDPETRYLRPRLADGTWVTPFSPTQELGFNEGNSTHYTWSAPQNISRLVEELGGPAKVEARLDAFFSKILVDGWNTKEPYFWPSNEPCFGVPYVYSWIGRPDKTQAALLRIRNLYTNSPDGIPGDDDVGAMSAYYLFNILGLYPAIPGVDGFTVSGLGVDRAVLHLGGGKSIRLERSAEGKGDYVAGLQVNGNDWSRSWIALEEVTSQREGSITFIMQDEPKGSWATAPQDTPPSFGP